MAQLLDEEGLADMEYSARVNAVQANANLASAQESYDNSVNGDVDGVPGDDCWDFAGRWRDWHY